MPVTAAVNPWLDTALAHKKYRQTRKLLVFNTAYYLWRSNMSSIASTINPDSSSNFAVIKIFYEHMWICLR